MRAHEKAPAGANRTGAGRLETPRPEDTAPAARVHRRACCAGIRRGGRLVVLRVAERVN